MIVGNCRLKKSMFIGNVPYCTTIWVIVGDIVFYKYPNILAVITDIKHDKLKLGVDKGVLSGYYSFHQVSKAPGVPTLLIQDVTESVSRSLREIIKLQSITGGQDMLKCDFKQGCKTDRCKCKQANVLCNSRCHHSQTCRNK